MSVQIIVYVYLVISASMIVFNLCYVFLYNSDDGKYRRRSKSINKVIIDHVLRIERGEDIPYKTIHKLAVQCENMWYLDAWDDKLTDLATRHPEAVNSYVLICMDIFRHLAEELKHKKPVQQAHFAYVVRKYEIVNKDPGGKILSFIETLIYSPSLHCRENALKVLYQYGDANKIVNAINSLSEQDSFHHEKLLVDGLLTFQGDQKQLMDLLLVDRERKNLFYQTVVLNFIRFGSGEYRDVFWDILQNPEEEDEIRFIALRYFAKYVDSRVEPILRELAQNPEQQRWEYAAIAVTALASYPGEETVRILKQCLRHGNWYIRYNAAVSLDRLQIAPSDLEDILTGDDRYAKEALEYHMQMNQFEKESKEESTCQQK